MRGSDVLLYTVIEHDPTAPLPAHVVKYACVREPPVIMPWICASCKDWTDRGSYAAGKCTRCGTARVDLT